VPDAEGGGGISGSHRTLPLPCYVEVTSLDSGRTILVRLERRGPMQGDGLVALSPGAMAQLGLSGAHAPVRVRRVNPPEGERALLRSGQQAPARMDTPPGLLTALKRKLGILPPADPRPETLAAALAGQAAPAAMPQAKPIAAAPAPSAKPIVRNTTPMPAPRPPVPAPSAPVAKAPAAKPAPQPVASPNPSPSRSQNRHRPPATAAISFRSAPFPRAPMPKRPRAKWAVRSPRRASSSAWGSRRVHRMMPRRLWARRSGRAMPMRGSSAPQGD
jgi:rare lipoprotein A